VERENISADGDQRTGERRAESAPAIPFTDALRKLSLSTGRAVLIVEPSPDHQARLARLVAVHGHRAVGTCSLDGALALLQVFPVDLVLLADEVAGAAPLKVVAEIVRRRPGSRIVIMTPPTSKGPAEPADTSPRLDALEYVPRLFGGDVLQSLLPG
jgi:ActR/RegA family two-component response regulator